MNINKGWKKEEERLLITNYHTKTILELVDLIGRNQEAINAKIKRLKAKGRLEGNKTEETVQRALRQRTK